MLKLLLDEHISPEVAKAIQRGSRSLVAHSLVQWKDGSLLGKEDSACLLEAAQQRLTLVTYDRRTIPPLLKVWAEEGRSHGGVIFVDEKTIAPLDIGGLVRALILLAEEAEAMDWTNQAYFLRSRR
ncbi:MAG TPA: hypothetical protein VKB58_06645 [Terriglobales bacterium]|jgi:hypothetical protein|nr:hypothetical protein [Terriglobales bacterium]